MHIRFLATFQKDDAGTSQEARNYVRHYLMDEGFVCDGRWGYGMGDWFVIGGRWSGVLSRHTWATQLTAQMEAVEKEKDVQVWGVFYGSAEKKEIQAELAQEFQRMWDEATPEAYRGIPVQRDTYKGDGYEDDAMILTQELYDSLLKEYEGEPDSDEHADLDYDDVSPEMVGKKWIVVVDYHS